MSASLPVKKVQITMWQHPLPCFRKLSGEGRAEGFIAFAEIKQVGKLFHTLTLLKNVILWIFQISLPLSIIIPLESCPRSQLLAPFALVSISHTWLIFSIMSWGVIMEQWSNLLFCFPDTLNTTQSVWQKLHYWCFKKYVSTHFR